MRIFRKALRYWIAITSVLSFLGGWVILAHSPKPVQPVTVQQAPLPAMPPIQAYGSTTTNNGLTFFNAPVDPPANPPANPQPSLGRPILRTRGS